MQRLLSLIPAHAVFRKFFVAMLAIDLAFVLLHVILRAFEAAEVIDAVPPLLSVFGDVGLAERFNHAKWMLIIILMAALFHPPPSPRLSRLLHHLPADPCGRRAAPQRARQRARQCALANHAGLRHVECGNGRSGRVGSARALDLAGDLWGMLTTERRWWPQAALILVGLSGLVFFGVIFDMMQEPLHHIETPGVAYWLLQLAGLVESAGESFFASFTAASAIAIHHSLYRPAAAGKVAPTP